MVSAARGGWDAGGLGRRFACNAGAPVCWNSTAPRPIPSPPPLPPGDFDCSCCRYQGSADAVRKNIVELKDEARGISPARDYVLMSGSGAAGRGAAPHLGALVRTWWSGGG